MNKTMSTTNPNLSYGLNARNTKNKRKKGLAGFDGSDDSNSDNDNAESATTIDGPISARSAINRDIAAEQAALRKRAQAAQAAMAASATDSAVYDYDADFDSFSSGKKKEDAARAAAAAKRNKDSQPKAKVQPRYINNLLKTATRRNQEQEIIHERQVVKDQAREEAENPQYEGKEKFVTSSYKRKLAERDEWAKDEAVRTQREEADDVTKRKKGLGSFMFGGIGRSLLMGGGGGAGERKGAAPDEDGDQDHSSKREADGQHDKNDKGIGEDARDEHRKSSTEAERWSSDKRRRDSDEPCSRRPPPSSRLSGDGNGTTKNAAATVAKQESGAAPPKSQTRPQILAERAIKLREARERYFERKGVVLQ
jgi:coiled-coil domain-containing protein 55